MLLLIATVVALVWANVGTSYDAVFGGIRFVVADGLMTVFFLGVGLEIRRELASGVLADRRRAALPLFAALGGMLVPAFVFAVVNRDGALRGCGVPTATDIAFAVGLVAVVRAPPALRALLLALAILDDIGAIVIIAVFYAHGIDPGGILLALLGVVLVVVLRRWRRWAHLAPGVLVWVGLWRAGIHPAVAGVVVGMLTPVADAARLEQILRPWTSLAIMPVFALANAGVSLDGFAIDRIFAGAALGLLLGKPIGIVLASALAVRLGLARLPAGLRWREVGLLGLVAGVGFTMSIFIAGIAFPTSTALASAKLGVLAGSLASGSLAVLVSRLRIPAPASGSLRGRRRRLP